MEQEHVLGIRAMPTTGSVHDLYIVELRIRDAICQQFQQLAVSVSYLRQGYATRLVCLSFRLCAVLLQSRQPISLKRSVMIGPINRKN